MRFMPVQLNLSSGDVPSLNILAQAMSSSWLLPRPTPGIWNMFVSSRPRMKTCSKFKIVGDCAKTDSEFPAFPREMKDDEAYITK